MIKLFKVATYLILIFYLQLFAMNVAAIEEIDWMEW